MNKEVQNTENKRLMSALDVMTLYSISSTTLWRHVKSGEIPKPFYIGKTRFWRYEDLKQ